MITITFMFFLLAFTLYFLYLGYTKKQYLFIIICGVLFLFNAYSMSNKIMVSEHINETIETCNCTETREGVLAKTVTNTYETEYLNDTVRLTLLTLYMLLGLTFILIGLYYFYKNPDLDNKNNEED